MCSKHGKHGAALDPLDQGQKRHVVIGLHPLCFLAKALPALPALCALPVMSFLSKEMVALRPPFRAEDMEGLYRPFPQFIIGQFVKVFQGQGKIIVLQLLATPHSLLETFLPRA